mmetsp:Transcript_2382/g.3640  ORF Transcript_2382/g.3640 Transcript_2382/m.3640 type:complete len:108 (+) Transcript_2382:1891-2214(+)
MRLKNISKLHKWPLHKVLIEKYRLNPAEAKSLAAFLERMLKLKPKDRASARDLLHDPWLKESDEYSVWMSRDFIREYKVVNHKDYPNIKEEIQKEKEKKAQQEAKRQ